MGWTFPKFASPNSTGKRPRDGIRTVGRGESVSNSRALGTSYVTTVVVSLLRENTLNNNVSTPPLVGSADGVTSTLVESAGPLLNALSELRSFITLAFDSGAR